MRKTPFYLIRQCVVYQFERREFVNIKLSNYSHGLILRHLTAKPTAS